MKMRMHGGRRFPPAEDEPLYLAAELPGESPPGKGQLLHLACRSFSEASMLQVPAMERCMKLADETALMVPSPARSPCCSMGLGVARWTMACPTMG